MRHRIAGKQLNVNSIPTFLIGGRFVDLVRGFHLFCFLPYVAPPSSRPFPSAKRTTPNPFARSHIAISAPASPINSARCFCDYWFSITWRSFADSGIISRICTIGPQQARQPRCSLEKVQRGNSCKGAGTRFGRHA